jgi:hypothetical protein
MTYRAFRSLASLAMAVGVIAIAAPAGHCQRAVVTLDPASAQLEIKALTGSDLKEAITYAMENGDLDQKDGKELINKITDIETLMDQFDFIRSHERSMVSSVGSSFH